MNTFQRLFGRVVAALLGIASLGAIWFAAAHADETPRAVPLPVIDTKTPGTGLETAVLAGGCFWGVQAVFQHVKGVREGACGLFRWLESNRKLRARRHRNDWPRGNRCRSNSTRGKDLLRQNPAHLFLCRPRPDAVTTARARILGQAIAPIFSSQRMRSRNASPKPISRNWTRHTSSQIRLSPVSTR